jgi:creatinine amidohydrolase
VIVNGHGGNDFKGLVRELQGISDLLIVTVNWWQIESGSAHFPDPGDHAGALETAVMLRLVPDLVAMEKAGAGTARPFVISAMREGWAWTPREWTKATEDTGVGDPRGVTAEAGTRYLESITTKLAGLFTELAACPRDGLYGEPTRE